MKKQLLLIVALFVAINMSAQFYAGLGLGYGLGASKRVIGKKVTATSNVNIYGSFGQGFNIIPKLGYMFNDNFGFELGIDYFMGAKLTLNESSTTIQEGQATGLILAPQFVMRTESGLYSRVGIFLPVAGKTVVTYSNSDWEGDGSNEVFNMEGERRGSFSLGLVGAIGYNYGLSDKMDLFVEVQYSYLSMKSGTYEHTKYEIGGVDILASMDVYGKQTVFVDEITTSSNNEYVNPMYYDKTKPKEDIRNTAPFSALGLNIGITMSF